MNKGMIIAIGMLFALAPAAVFANVINVPGWRGDAETTYQEWSFSTGDNPAAPDMVNNPFGTASAAMSVGPYGVGWLHQLPGMGTETGYWSLGEGGTITLDIDNTATAGDYQEIMVQIVYYHHISLAPVVDVPGAMFVGSEAVQYEAVVGGGEWLLGTSTWQIPAGTTHEQVIIAGDLSYGSEVSHIVVDTILVPEPMSIFGLLAGLAMIVRKRR